MPRVTSRSPVVFSYPWFFRTRGFFVPVVFSCPWFFRACGFCVTVFRGGAVGFGSRAQQLEHVWEFAISDHTICLGAILVYF